MHRQVGSFARLIPVFVCSVSPPMHVLTCFVKVAHESEGPISSIEEDGIWSGNPFVLS